MIIVIITQCWKIIILSATSLNSVRSTNAMLFRELINWLDWTLSKCFLHQLHGLSNS
jgi:hypothetical protein